MLASHVVSETPDKTAQSFVLFTLGFLSLGYWPIGKKLHEHNTQKPSAALPHQIGVHSLLDHPWWPQGLESQFLKWNL